MSDVIVSTSESVTDVTTTNDVTTIAITDSVVDVAQSTAGFQGAPYAKGEPIYVVVTNKTGSTLSKGAIVYTSGANGNHTQVSLASAASDATSARTLGWVADDIANNADGYVIVEGYLEGVNTHGITEGAQLYLSGTTPGGFTQTKPQAPTHLVYVGVAAKASAGNGKVYVKVQNGYELDELHDVKIVAPANNDLLRYVSGTALWENVASTAVTVGSAVTAGTASYASLAGTAQYAVIAGTASYATTAGTLSGSITRSQVTDFSSGTVAVALTASTATNLSGSITRSQVSDFTSGTVAVALTASTAVSLTGNITRAQVSDFSSGTVSSASTAQQAGTALFASNAGNADYATTSGTAVFATNSSTATTISGSITRSQVSDFSSGTVAVATNASTATYATTSGTAVSISGSITQSQVTNLTTDLSGKADKTGNNTFTGTQTLRATPAIGGETPATITGGTGQSVPLTRWQTVGLISLATIDSNGYGNFARVTAGSNADLGYAVLSVNTTGTATKGLVIRGAASQSANLQEWQDSAGTVLASVNSGGAMVATNGVRTNAIGNLTTSNNSRIQTGTTGVVIDTAVATNVVTIIRGAASQTASLQEWQNSSGGTVTRITASGSLLFPNSGSSINGDSGNATFITNSSATVGLVVRGAASQSANLQEWQNSAGGTVARVNSSGILLATSVRTLTSLFTASEESSGGSIIMTKLTALGGNPGANIGKIYFRDGTNAGTLKLVVRAGAAGAETTILDNIPT